MQDGTKYATFEAGPDGRRAKFQGPSDILRTDDPGEVPGLLAEIDRLQRSGLWLAGSASYELGYLFSSKLRPLLPPGRRLPLLEFGVFEQPPEPVPAPTAPAVGALTSLYPRLGPDAYRRAFDAIKAYIAAGDIYQANLTFPVDLDGAPDTKVLEQALATRQHAPYGATVDLGGATLLSRSPELFFTVNARRQITTRPMKGTAPRSDDPAEDERLRDWLLQSPKNRAENLMIVDLLRNDLARVSRIGSVRVPELFTLETYATLHQMVSTVTADLLPGVGFAQIMEAIFPCGSITGAPKIRAMQVIRELEDVPRGAYCGAIGWIAPDGRMLFNVAIRTITRFEDGTALLNVGGGIVHDSDGDAEYQEALLKAQFALLGAAG